MAPGSERYSYWKRAVNPSPSVSHAHTSNTCRLANPSCRLPGETIADKPLLVQDEMPTLALTAVPLAATIQIFIQELTKARREKVAEARVLDAGHDTAPAGGVP